MGVSDAWGTDEKFILLRSFISSSALLAGGKDAGGDHADGMLQPVKSTAISVVKSKTDTFRRCNIPLSPYWLYYHFIAATVPVDVSRMSVNRLLNTGMH